jgi:hypothetical protein
VKALQYDQICCVVVHLPAGERALERGAERVLERAGGLSVTWSLPTILFVALQADVQSA